MVPLLVVQIILNASLLDLYPRLKAADQIALAEPKLIGQNENGKDIYLKNGRFGPYLQYEIDQEEKLKKLKKKKK